MAKQNLLGHSQNGAPKPSRSLARSHADYWKARLFRPSNTRDGEVCEVNDLAIRIQHGGRRETFTLSTTNKDAAAIKARDIFTTIRGAGSVRTYYRCEEIFDRLNAWLRSKGITSNKPLHELRKEAGAIVATANGIYATSRYPRHSDITTTARHYADQKQRINVGLGKLLDTSCRSARTVPSRRCRTAAEFAARLKQSQ